MEYKVVRSEGLEVADVVEDLQEEVNSLCEKGWNVQGGIAIVIDDDDWCHACQAMVKY